MAKFRFGERSQRCIATCREELQRVLTRAIGYQIMDFAVLHGHRGRNEQNELYARGLSKKQWPDSEHNVMPSDAFDVAPWPINWKDSLAFARLAGIIEVAAAEEGITLRWGGDWDRDGSSHDQTFMDLGHFEIYSES